MFRLLLVSSLFQALSAQMVIPLSTFRGGNYKNYIPATPPYSLYVSARMDTSIVSNQIFLKSDDGIDKSIEELKNNKAVNSSGLLTPLKIQSQTYVISNLADTQMAALEGFIYITTAKQSNDVNFKVIDVDKSQLVRTSLLLCDPCTLVFLNSNTMTVPVQSSTISTWRQLSPDSVVKMYRAWPTDDGEPDKSQIFSNPIQLINNQEIRMPIVEKFSVSLGTFFFKTTGDFYFLISPYYSDPDTTTGYTTTGLYMKSLDQNPTNVTINCARDTRFNGTTGANFIGSLPNPDGKVIVAENDGMVSNSMTINPAMKINHWTFNHIGSNITINSVNADGGMYFVQYFVIQDQEISSTFAPTNQVPTTRSTETTTKGGSLVDCMVGTLVMAMLSWIL